MRTQVQNGQPYFLLRDPLQLSENSLLVPQQWGVVLASLDGKTSARRGGAAPSNAASARPCPHGELAALVTALDEVYLLDNDRARAAQQRAVDAYRSRTLPPAAPGRTGLPGRSRRPGRHTSTPTYPPCRPPPRAQT